MTSKPTHEELEGCVKESAAQLTKADEQLRLEIIKRKQAEEALQEKRNYLESLVNHANVPIIVWDPDLRITRLNSALEHLTGYAADEIIGKGLEILFPETSCEYFLGKALASSSERWDSVEIPIRCKNGKNRTVLWNSANIYAKDGATLIAGIAQGIDITDYKLAEEKTRSAYAELKQIFDIIHSGVRLVDKNFNVLKLNQAILNLCGISMDEAKGKKCYETFSCNLCNTPECILIRILSGEEHIELEVEKKCVNGATIPCTLSAAPFRGYAGDLIGMVENVRDITKFKNVENELKDSLKDLSKALRGTIQAMALTVGTRDPYTAGHQRRVTDLARAIAKEMGFSRSKIAGIRMAGIVHDIGKIAIPSEILAKPGQLSKAEVQLIKNHPQAGYDILKPIKFPGPVAQIVLQHHERMDGSGYPQGLSGEDILPEARILGVADVVEAMASHRPYRAALGIDKALEEISINRGKLYDVEAVDACLKVFKENGFKFNPN